MGTLIPVSSAGGNPYGQDIIWPWIKRSWPEIKNRLGSTKFLLGRIVTSLSASTDIKLANEIMEYFEKNPEDKIKMSISQTLERIKINYRFLESIRHTY